MRVNIFGIVLVALIVLTPQVSSAYELIDTAAVRLNDSFALYRVTFFLGSDTYEFKTPVRAALRDSAAENETAIALYDSERQQAEIDTSPFVMAFASSARIENGSYVIERGASAEVSVVALVPTADIDLSGYAMRITDLPLSLTTAEGEVYENAVKVSDFNTYITEPLADVVTHAVTLSADESNR